MLPYHVRASRPPTLEVSRKMGNVLLGNRRLAALGITALAVTALGAGTMSLALFTDDKDITDNSFATGTIVLNLNPTSALFNVPALMPGDSAFGQLTVTNAGTASLRYSMTTAANNADSKDLRDVVTLEIRQKASGTCSADFTGTAVMAESALASAAFGNPAQGQQSGDRVLASGSEMLCFKASLPLATGNAYQGAATTATFTFRAEQTASNP